MKLILTRIYEFLSSRKFYTLILAFFIFEAIWIALSAVYPQAFDEDYHFGLIQIYSHYWLPFIDKQPIGADAYGAVTRDPSYLYHYLMSFPYRFIALFVHGKVGQVIALRFINIGLFATGLVLFRKILLRLRLSSALTNTILAIFILIPITPQLAAQINYDNLLIPLVAWTCLLAFNVIEQIRKQWVSVRTLLTLFIVCTLSSLVQYEFLPIYLGIVIYLGLYANRTFKGHYKKLWELLSKSWRQHTSKLSKVILVGLSIISIIMFVQRDGVNIVKYHNIAPDCSSILSVPACSVYSVWDHDYVSHLQVITSNTRISSNPIKYLGQWSYWTWYRLFFAVNGPVSSFTNYPPLPLPSAAFVIVGIVGVVAIIAQRKRLFSYKNSFFLFLALITAFYLIALITEGFLKYKYTNVPELMNGRYLLPVLIFVAAISGVAISTALRKRPLIKIASAAVVLLLFFEGGGIFTFISRSDSSWDWPNNAVVKANNAARQITKPVIVKGDKTYTTPFWFFN